MVLTRTDSAHARYVYLLNLMVMAAGFVALGAALVLQPARWSHTPAYANLLLIVSAQAWGLIYLVVAAVMLLGVWKFRLRWLLVAAHSLSIPLVLSWLLAFVVRYITDAGTTPANVVAWSVYLYLLVASGRSMDALHAHVGRVTGTRDAH